MLTVNRQSRQHYTIGRNQTSQDSVRLSRLMRTFMGNSKNPQADARLSEDEVTKLLRSSERSRPNLTSSASVRAAALRSRPIRHYKVHTHADRIRTRRRLLRSHRRHSHDDRAPRLPQYRRASDGSLPGHYESTVRAITPPTQRTAAARDTVDPPSLSWPVTHL